MRKIEYSPEAKNKLHNVKIEITTNYGETIAIKILRKITRSIRKLEIFAESGTPIFNTIGIPYDYRYLYIEKNYVFYRIEGDVVKIVNILNEKQDFMRTLFGTKTTTDETEDYWNE